MSCSSFICDSVVDCFVESSQSVLSTQFVTSVSLTFGAIYIRNGIDGVSQRTGASTLTYAKFYKIPLSELDD